jgi:rod shape-determining protein MreC
MANGTWRIARSRGNAQLPMLVVAVLAIVIVLIGKSQSGIFDRARSHFSDWTRPVLEAISVPVNAVSEWVGGIGHIFVVYKENLALKEENARLRQWQGAALTLEDRVKRYQLLLNAVPDPALTNVTARVIGRESHPFLDTMILDAGKKDGVMPGQAVVDARGMIGRIFLAGERTSWVILLTDLNSRIPVAIHPGNTQAIMSGDNSGAPGLDTLAQGAQLKDGDQVVTSGDGGLLPPGLPIGTLVADGNAFKVALFADAATSDEVQVISFRNPKEEIPAPSPNDLPASAAGLAPLTTPPPASAATPAANGAAVVNAPPKPQALGAAKPPLPPGAAKAHAAVAPPADATTDPNADPDDQ